MEITPLDVNDNKATLVIDGVSYIYSMANAEPAYKAFKAACAVIKDASKDSDILAVIASNIGHPAIDNCEKLVRNNLVVSVPKDNGEVETFKVNDRFDSHFNKHRKHLLVVMFNGLKYQFGDFFDMSGLGL